MTAETYPCYVKVCTSGETEDCLDVTTEEDGTMLLSTLESHFPRTIGLRFKSDVGSWRGVCLNENDVMEAPFGGWGDSQYFVVQRKKAAKRKATVNEGPLEKLSKMTEDEILSDLIVLGLPYAATEDDVQKHFEQYGELDLVEIKYDGSKKSRGFGFIRFQTVEAVKAALEATHILYNRTVEIRFPKEDLKQDTVPAKLFIGRLPRGTTVEELREHFLEYGSIRDVYIPTPFRGFGFVTYDAQSSAREAINSTHVIKGTYVNVSHPSPKKPDMNGQSNQGNQGNMYGMMRNMPHGSNMKGMQGNMQMQGPPQSGPQPLLGYGGYGGYNSGNYSYWGPGKS